MKFHDVSDFELEYQRNVCESMLSPFFNPSQNLRRDIEHHLANVNREIGRRMARNARLGKYHDARGNPRKGNLKWYE